MAPAETYKPSTTDEEFLSVLQNGGVDVCEVEADAFVAVAAEMCESPADTSRDTELAIRRLLTEVTHLRRGRRPDGTYALELLEGVRENLITKVQEDAMSHAVSRSYQPVAEMLAEGGERRRTFIWRGLGKTAIEVAESGYNYHETEAAFRRVGIEVKEACRSCETLTPGTFQCFISPRMSRADASYEVAESEHLADEDAVRVYEAVTDASGRVIGRQMQSLLVRDVPLEAWVRMLKDPGNIFGKAFEIKDASSALSVMDLFNQLDLPEPVLPEGPVTLVAEVVKYITDAVAKASVDHQLVKFREDQKCLRYEAEVTAGEWLKFEQALSDSLEAGRMLTEVQRLVMIFQSDWSAESQKLLKQHERGSGYSMSVELAAHLEQAWQKAYLGEVAAAVGDERALKEVDKVTAKRLQQNALRIRALQRSGARPEEIASMRAHQLRDVVHANVQAGGGCSGKNEFEFGNDDKDGSDGEASAENGTNNQAKRSNEGVGEVHEGVCRTDGCPSRPGKTRVGGCNVCLKYCQPLWDKGRNPEDIYQKVNPQPKNTGKQSGEKQYIGTFLSGERKKAKAEDKMRTIQESTGKLAVSRVG
jgi:hypothetical protein